jgi:hypothetical protein
VKLFAAVLVLILGIHSAKADSTIDPDAAFAWGGNVGELNWRPSLADGVLTGEYVCSGMIWAANAGWINVGSGAAANGIRYQNDDGADCGVNLLADGSLRGLAWGESIGWVNFEPVGNPRIDFGTGVVSGYAWGANVGWITLSAAGDHSVATYAIPSGEDSDSDGLTDAWELDHASDLLTLTIDGDADGDGMMDIDEYAADTDPLAGDDRLRITAFTASTDTTLLSLTWTSRLSRRYRIETKTDLGAGMWQESLPGEITPDSNVTTQRGLVLPAAPQRFFRIRAMRPLVP